jgi:exodeoxyribonuclease V gamma subunit
MAGFHLYTSNRLERLSEKLISILGAAPLPPMQPEIIVVQSKGMEHWLRLEIAGRMAMCANTVFPFPRLFVYQIFRELIDQPDISPYSPDIVAWKIMKVLPEVLDNPAFSSLKRYLAGEDTALKRFQLAEKIAAVFDQYLIFRPDVINGWDRTTAADDFPHAAWQALLWQTLSHNEHAALHPAALKKAFLDAARNGFQPADLPSRISVFGISTLPPYYLEVFSALAQSRDIHFLYLSPCREYWEYAYSEKDIARFAKTGLTSEDQYFDTGNRLLASMGASGREFFSLMLNTVGETGADMYEDPGDETMLSRIQSDILNLHDREESAGPGGADGSLQIHSCHSPVRGGSAL